MEDEDPVVSSSVSLVDWPLELAIMEANPAIAPMAPEDVDDDEEADAGREDDSPTDEDEDEEEEVEGDLTFLNIFILP